MIRDIKRFFKQIFKNISEITLYQEAVEQYSAEKLQKLKLKCPSCGAENHPWLKHDTYPRNLICFENGKVACHVIEILRIMCSSCKHTHAVLPDVIVPYTSYSLLFIISVLFDYYSHMPVHEVCAKYQISASTLYAWKKQFLVHKRLWLGIVQDAIISALEFLKSLLTFDSKYDLSYFFKVSGRSFMQGSAKKAHFSSA